MGKTSTGLQFLSANIKVRKLSILAVNVLFWVKIAKYDLRCVGRNLKCACEIQFGKMCDVRACGAY